MTDHPDTLAAAAQALSDAWDEYMESDIVDPVAEAIGRLRAALAAHDQQDPSEKCLHTGDAPSDSVTGRPPCQRPKDHDGLCSQWENGVPDLGDDEDDSTVLAMVPLPGDGWYSVKVEHQVDKDQEGHPMQTWEVRAKDGSVRVEPMGHAEPADVSDTPEPPRGAKRTLEMIEQHKAEHAATWKPHGTGFVPDGTSLATPEGGQPDTDDELLARFDACFIEGAVTSVEEWMELACGLAPALRRKRDELDEERKVANAGWQEFSVAHKDIERLERELAEARSHGEVLARGVVADAVHRHADQSVAFVRIEVDPGYVGELLDRRVVVRATADQEETDGG